MSPKGLVIAATMVSALASAGAGRAGEVISTSVRAGSSAGTYDYFGPPSQITQTVGGSPVTFAYYPTPTLGEVFTPGVSGRLTSFSLYLYGSTGSVSGAVSIWTPSTAATVGTDGGTFGGTTGAPLYESGTITSPATTPTGTYFSGPLSSAPVTAYTFHPDVAVVAGQTYIAYLTVLDGSTTAVQSGATTFVQAAEGDAPPVAAQTAPVPPTPVGADYAAWNNFYYCDISCTGPGMANPDVSPNNNPLWLQPTFLTNTDFVATIGTVPEPAGWALMLVGFGGIGGALRFRHGAAVARA